MKIIKPGTRRPERVYTLQCPDCGCMAEMTETEMGTEATDCPMEWCGAKSMDTTGIRDSSEPPPRTKAEVLNERANGPGCCNRFAEMSGCDCYTRATGRCPVCSSSGFYYDRGNTQVSRCPHGCVQLEAK